MPETPAQLLDHDCLVFATSGLPRQFLGPQGLVGVEVLPRLKTNDAMALCRATLAGQGIAVLADYLVAPHLRSGTLVEVLPQLHPPDLWLKALYQAAASNCHAFRPCCADCKDNSRCRRYRNRCPICTPRAIQKSHPSTPGRSARGCDAVTWHRRMHGGSETERLRKRPGLFRPDRFGDLRIQLDQALVAGCRLYRQIQPESA